MKAQDAAIVALIIIINGLIPNEILTVAKIGNIIETVARFEVISVKKLTAKTINSIINITDKNVTNLLLFFNLDVGIGFLHIYFLINKNKYKNIGRLHL